MDLFVTHRTHYLYAGPCIDSHNEVRLQPATDENQICRKFQLLVDPKTEIFSYHTPFGEVHHFSVLENHSHLDITAESWVSTSKQNPYSSLNLVESDWDLYHSDQMRQRYSEYLTESHYVNTSEERLRWVEKARKEDHSNVMSFLFRLKEMIFESFEYQTGATNVHTKLDEVFKEKAGVCQDFAHVMIGICRSAGIPARYISGYLYLGDDHQLRGTQATHAWVEVPTPEGKWIGIDPTNNILADDRYIKIQSGRDYSDVTPTKGVYKGYPTLELNVEVSVDRLESTILHT